MSSQLIIPPRPQILLELQTLANSPDPDINELTNVIKQDVALYTILLSVTNSPIYRRPQPITSIEQAVVILGLEKVMTLVRAVILRSSLDSSGLAEEFWSATTEVASLCALLSDKFLIADNDSAYTLGMLHAVGVPVMLDNFPEYKKFIIKHGYENSKTLCFRERDQFSTDHYHQGHELAKQWGIAEEVSLAVRYQPITQAVLKDSKHLPAKVPTLLALLYIAKTLSNDHRRYWHSGENTEELTKQVAPSLRYLQISEADFLDLHEELADSLYAEAV